MGPVSYTILGITWLQEYIDLSHPTPLHPKLPSLYFPLTNGGFIMGKNLIEQDRWLSVEEIAIHLGIKGGEQVIHYSNWLGM